MTWLYEKLDEAIHAIIMCNVLSPILSVLFLHFISLFLSLLCLWNGMLLFYASLALVSLFALHPLC